MTTTADDMFTKGGLAVFLTSTDRIGSGKWSHPPHVPVYFVPHRPVYVTADDLRCPSCDTYHDPPDDKPVTWLAANKVLNSGLCTSCG